MARWPRRSGRGWCSVPNSRGYVTGISGKWHLDAEDQRPQGGPKNVKYPDLGPWGQGFDEYFTKRTIITAESALSQGETLTVEGRLAKDGTVTLWVNDEQVGHGKASTLSIHPAGIHATRSSPAEIRARGRLRGTLSVQRQDRVDDGGIGGVKC